MARTTIALDPDLLRQIKIRAAQGGVTMQTKVNDLLRQALHTPEPKPYRLELGALNSEANPDLDVCDRDSIAQVLGGRWG